MTLEADKRNNEQEQKSMLFVELGEQFSLAKDDNGRKLHLHLGNNRPVKSLVFDIGFHEQVTPYSGVIESRTMNISSNTERMVKQGLIIPVERRFAGMQLPSKGFTVDKEVLKELATLRLQEFMELFGRIEHHPRLSGVLQGKVNFSLNLPLVAGERLESLQMRFVTIEDEGL